MITGPKADLLYSLGSTTKGIRTIVRIGADDQITCFKFTSLLGSNATLLHLAFDVDHINNYTFWLLASSSIVPSFGYGYQMIFDFEWSTIKAEDITVILTQQCKAHRVLPTESNVFATAYHIKIANSF